MARTSNHATPPAGTEVSRPRPVRRIPEPRLDPRWDAIKSRFVDDPPGAVKEASVLVREAIDRAFEALRGECDDIGRGSNDHDTEELRRRLHRLGAMLERLGSTSMH